MSKFRSLPKIIDAFLFTGKNWRAALDFIGENNGYWNVDRIAIHTLEGTMSAMPGDWIIRGVAGEFYPCKPEIFAATYEAVE